MGGSRIGQFCLSTISNKSMLNITVFQRSVPERVILCNQWNDFAWLRSWAQQIFGYCMMPATQVFWSLKVVVSSRTPPWTTLAYITYYVCSIMYVHNKCVSGWVRKTPKLCYVIYEWSHIYIHITFMHGLRTPREEIAFTAQPKIQSQFLGVVEAYFVCHIGPIFQISLLYAFIGCP